MKHSLPAFGLRLVRDLRGSAVALAVFAASPALAADLAALSAAPIAVELGAGSPALVILWTPGCMACRKSLAEIERFIPMAAQHGVTVLTLVPDADFDASSELLARRKLTLPVASAGDRLDGATRRILLDSPLAYAVDRDGRIAAARGGLLGVKGLEALANAARAGETATPALSR